PPAPAEKPPDVIKPPKEPPPKNRLPEPNAPRSRKQKPEPEPARSRTRPSDARTPAAASRGGTAQSDALEIGPPGVGVPDGTDSSGDCYMSTVIMKIRQFWLQQIPAGMTQPVTVELAILADGSVADVNVVETSGVFLIDQAAKRAIYSA